MIATASFAQNTRLVKGVVFDHEDIPMVGATVTVAGMSETSQTGANGTFEIYVSPYAKKVTIKAEGYISQSAEIDGSYLMFKLKINSEYAKRKAQEAEQARIAAEKAKAEEVARLAAEKAERERIAAEKAKAEKEERERIAAEKIAAEKASEAAAINNGENTNINTHLSLTYGPYKVGDVYNDGVKIGIVFEVSADGLHGKIASLEQVILPWSLSEGSKKASGAKSKDDGATNLKVVQKNKDWQYKYPAIEWCASLGDDWYLPSMQEVKQFIKYYKTLNKTIAELGINTIIKYHTGYYWSSTEFSATHVYLVFKEQAYGFDKLESNYVRAIATF